MCVAAHCILVRMEGIVSRTAIVCTLLSGASLFAQAPRKVDFRRDVQPIFKAQCISCHGPTLAMNNFRLDRRRDAMKGGTIAMIGPGNSAGSRMYYRLIGNQYGIQMPPTGPLPKEQVEIIKNWIDQGAEWPDDLSGEAPSQPPDPKATRVMAALRQGDRQTFQTLLREDPKVASRKGPGGSTPLMYAVQYADAGTVRSLLEAGADPNIRNDVNATALMWAADDLEKSRLLIEHGADVNARSDDGRTPLLIAAGRYGSSALVKLLLDRGADPAAKGFALFGESTALSEALFIGDAAVVKMLLDRGANLKEAGYLPLVGALRSNCAGCVERTIEPLDGKLLSFAMTFDAPPLGDAGAVKQLLARGANANAMGPFGHILPAAAAFEAMPVDTIKALLDRGADVNAKSPRGETALDYARRQGNKPLVDFLLKAGGKEGTGPAAQAVKPNPAASARAAIERSIPLLQKSDVTFIKKSGCVSCHNNTFTAMTVSQARKQGFAVNNEIARKQLQTIVTYIDSWRERALQGIGIPGNAETVSYILLGLAAENHPPDPATDALAFYLRSQQLPDGHWQILAYRPPLEASDFQVTATSLHALQIYAPKTQRAAYDKTIQLAAGWLKNTQPKSNDDHAFRILGLAWAGGNKDVIAKAVHDLVGRQRPDGGWAQIPALASDAYATGQALVALRHSGAVPVTDAAFQRGVKFLMSTQLADGSWYVRSRAVPLQPYFESDFPHGHDQWISATATNWAAMALLPVAQ